MKRLFALSIIAILLCGSALADEGMWLYNAFPKDKVKAKYGFEVTQDFLDHMRLSSVRAGGGSASFVSPDGLVFTNHHIGAGCIHNISTPTKDYMKLGFYAATRADEAKCPGLELSVLQDIKDVTEDVQSAAKPDMPPAQAAAAQRAAMTRIEHECSANGARCDIVTLYAGAMYHLYRYKQYNDVRLVFAPEYDAAFFGGDPDNFTYPRYDLDITFFRIYENGQPIHVDHYLKWSTNGAKEGDLIFVSGHPGATGRLLTMAEMEFRRDVQYPFSLKSMTRRIDVLKKFSAQSEENNRIAERELFGLQNSFKATTGYNVGLVDKASMAKKAAEEKAMRDFIAADPKLKAQYGDPWAEIAKAEKVHREIFTTYNYVEGALALRGSMALAARTLVRAADERSKPNEQRLRGYDDASLPQVERRMANPAPVFKSLEQANLTDGLADMRDALGADNPVVQKILAGRQPAEAAKALIEGSKLDDPAVRKALFQGGKAALDASNDPLIAVMRAIDPEARAVRKRMEDEVEAVVRRNATLIAKASFAKFGVTKAPDATGTLRVNYGVVKSYTLGGKHVPYFTTFAGAYEHAAKNGNKPPYQLPESWMKAKSALDLNVPLNTVNTADSIGGNSGSPTVNTKGEIVGILFDGNIESLPWNFFFDDTVGRTVLTDSRGILEALRKIYNAPGLATELTGKPATAGGSK